MVYDSVASPLRHAPDPQMSIAEWFQQSLKTARHPRAKCIPLDGLPEIALRNKYLRNYSGDGAPDFRPFLEKQHFLRAVSQSARDGITALPLWRVATHTDKDFAKRRLANENVTSDAHFSLIEFFPGMDLEDWGDDLVRHHRGAATQTISNDELLIQVSRSMLTTLAQVPDAAFVTLFKACRQRMTEGYYLDFYGFNTLFDFDAAGQIQTIRQVDHGLPAQRGTEALNRAMVEYGCGEDVLGKFKENTRYASLKDLQYEEGFPSLGDLPVLWGQVEEKILRCMQEAKYPLSIASAQRIFGTQVEAVATDTGLPKRPLSLHEPGGALRLYDDLCAHLDRKIEPVKAGLAR